MKKLYARLLLPIVLTLILWQVNISKLSAQTFQVDTILYNGNPSKFINFVFLSDGFQTGEFSSYVTNVQNFTNYLFNIAPFKEYKNYFNVFAIKVPSVQSGADHPNTAFDCPSLASHPVQTVNNYFNSTFDYGSIHRLLVPTNNSAINSVILNNFPQVDQVMILVNSPYYGGSGGIYATASLDASSYEVMIHELGHSFGGLADEYYAGDNYAGEYVNMTQQTNPALVKWKNWMGFGGTGIYQHCCGGNSSNWYRPHQGCKMRYLGTGYPFCPVCKETIVEKIHQVFGSPIIAHLPSAAIVSYCSQPIPFKLTTIKPIPNTLRVKWKLNGNTILSNIDSITIHSGLLNIGANTLIAEVFDTTSLSRSDAHFQTAIHTYTKSWTINYNSIQPVTITANGPLTFCQGNSVTLTASSANSYLWNTGATTQAIHVTTSGNFSVTVTDVNGCTATSPFTEIIVNSLPPTPIITVIDDTILSSSSPIGNQWYLDGNSISGATEQTYIITQNGSYTVVVSDENGCVATSTPYIYTTVGISELTLDNNLIIIPNPNDGRFRIMSKNFKNAEIKIYNSIGEIIFQSKLSETEINLSNQAKGIYFIELKMKDKEFNKKLIIQ